MKWEGEQEEEEEEKRKSKALKDEVEGKISLKSNVRLTTIQYAR